MAEPTVEKKERKKRTTKATDNLLLNFVTKLNSNQSEYVRHHLKKHFGADYAGSSDFEKELHEGVKAALTV